MKYCSKTEKITSFVVLMANIAMGGKKHLIPAGKSSSGLDI